MQESAALVKLSYDLSDGWNERRKRCVIELILRTTYRNSALDASIGIEHRKRDARDAAQIVAIAQRIALFADQADLAPQCIGVDNRRWCDKREWTLSLEILLNLIVRTKSQKRARTRTCVKRNRTTMHHPTKQRSPALNSIDDHRVGPHGD